MYIYFVLSMIVNNYYPCFQIMGYKIFTHEIHSSYASRIDNYRSYDSISKDIIQRWTYPLVPDVQFSRNCATKLERQGMYRSSGKDLMINMYFLLKAFSYSCVLFWYNLCILSLKKDPLISLDEYKILFLKLYC